MLVNLTASSNNTSGGFSFSYFGTSPTFSACTTSSNNTSGGFSFPAFGGSSTSSVGFQCSTPAATSTATTTTTNTSSIFSFGSPGASSNQPVFGNAPKFSFSDLAKQSSTTNSDKSTSNGAEQRGIIHEFEVFSFN